MNDDNSFLRREEFEGNTGKIEESGKILGKDLWVKAHSEESTVERFKRQIAPVELNGLNKVRRRNNFKGLRIET